MPFRAWLFIAAFGVIFTASHAQEDVSEQEVGPGAGQSDTADQGEDRTVEAGAMAPSPATETSTESDHSAPADGTGQAQEGTYVIFGDTYAQWAMALLGFFALLVSAWAVWLIRGTLIATREAVREAKAATKSAQEATAVSREIGEAQVRAYLTVTSAVLMGRAFRPDTVKLTIKNSGQSPAYDSDLIFKVRNGEITQRPALAIIAAGSEETFNFCVYPSKDDDAVRQMGMGDHGLIVIESILQYRTVFDRAAERLDTDTAFTIHCLPSAPSRPENVEMGIETNLRCDWIADYQEIMKAKSKDQSA